MDARRILASGAIAATLVFGAAAPTIAGTSQDGATSEGDQSDFSGEDERDEFVETVVDKALPWR